MCNQLIDILLLVSSEVMGSQHHQPSGSNPSGVSVLLGSTQSVKFFHLVGWKTTQRIWLKISCIAPEGKLNVLDFV